MKRVLEDGRLMKRSKAVRKRVIGRKYHLAVLCLAVLLLFGLTACGGTKEEDPGNSAADIAQGEAAASSFSEPERKAIGIHHAVLTVAEYGAVTLELDGDTAPVTVENFIRLADAGFYDGLTFHRIIDGFMIQGGDPQGDGTGGADEEIIGEFAENGYENNISHEKGVISMARSADPNSASSQFFITVANADYLDGSYAAFGHVTEGMDVIEHIASDADPTDDNGTIRPDEQPVIESIRILD